MHALHVVAAVVNAVANWDLCTVAVFTCLNSCSRETLPRCCDVAQEEVVLVIEADCEAATAAAATATPPGGTAQQPDSGSDWC